MKFLVFQHIAVEHPGIFRDFMQGDGIIWDTVELDEGDVIPDLSQYDALMVMGGPMDVWEEVKYPWLIDEKQAIRYAVSELKLPYLGFCLGHQLLADALGGKVGLMPEPEVGVMPVTLTQAGLDSPFFQAMSSEVDTLQWHGAAVLDRPNNSTNLANSTACPNQALQIANHAFSMQFHIEITNNTVSDWAKIPEYQKSLETLLGPGSVATLENTVDNKMEEFNQTARCIYNNFIAVVNDLK